MIEAAEDWLESETRPTQLIDSEVPADAGLPGLPLSKSSIIKADEAAARHAQAVAAWEELTNDQRVWLNTWRECRFNYARARRVLSNTTITASKTTLHRWRTIASFELMENLMRSASIEEILHRDYLAARQEDIVETLLTPKPVLHQGFATGFFEVEAGAASKANEVLLRLGGHMKDKELDLNIGIVGPQFVIQVVQPDGGIKDVAPTGVTIDLPAPADDAEWLDGGA